MIAIDGSFGEGGGQILRTALALSVLTKQPFEMHNIRSGREKAGLKAQHLSAILAAKELCGAVVDGAFLGSKKLCFNPGAACKSKLNIDVGTAGSAVLVLQAVLLPCFFSGKRSTIKIKGGSDVLWSPQFNYFQEVFVPFLRRFCNKIDVRLVRRGYFPAGNGEIAVKITPKFSFAGLSSLESFRDVLKDVKRFALFGSCNLLMIKGVCHSSVLLSGSRVAERMASSAENFLRKRVNCPVNIKLEYSKTDSVGCGIVLWAVFSNAGDDVDFDAPLIAGADFLGEKNVSAEVIGERAAGRLSEYLKNSFVADEFLVDQLLPWMVLLDGSCMNASVITKHALANIYVIEKFFGKCVAVDESSSKITSF